MARRLKGIDTTPILDLDQPIILFVRFKPFDLFLTFFQFQLFVVQHDMRCMEGQRYFLCL